MFNSTALDVVIGLVFIYLLYSLLATVISEIIATQLGLRARNLKEAIDRMLNDEKEGISFLRRLWDSMKLMKNPKNPIINNFYNHPEIKYLGSSGIFKTPSSFSAVSFSKTLLNVLFGDNPLDKDKIEIKLKEIIENSKKATSSTPKDPGKSAGDAVKLNENEKKLDPDTADYIKSLWDESYGDVIKFKLLLEGWFDRTMNEATEWYKRKIQIVTFIVGFCLAWFFCVDTFSIVNKLSTDKVARDQIVNMANTYVQNNKTLAVNPAIDSSTLKSYNQKLDSLLEAKKDLDAHIANVNTILGMGAWLPDKVKVITKNNENIYIPQIDATILNKKPKNGEITFDTCNKMKYFFGLLCHHFWGFLITAIAISLGAPFWFDLLNKIMKLRTSKKESTDSTIATNSNNYVSPLNREA